MATKNEVQKVIKDNINSNGNNSITGQILQDVLLQMTEKDYLAGNNISITNEVISANGYTYDPTNNSFAEGENTTASGDGSHAEGYSTIASGDFSHSEGDSTISSGFASHAEGISKAEGDYSHAEGGSTASGFASHAEGSETTASEYASHAEGGTTTASGGVSHAEGANTTALGDISHSEGLSSNAKGGVSHSEGDSTIANGYASHSEGFNSITGGTASTNDLTAGSSNNPGAYAHAEGNATIAKGISSHAEGKKTFASGNASHSEGSGSIGIGIASHAEGFKTKATNKAEHAEGKYNKSNTDTISSIGIGTSDTDRKNAFEVMNTGDVYIKDIGGYDGVLGENSKSLQQYLLEQEIKIVNVYELSDVEVNTGPTIWPDADLYHYCDTYETNIFFTEKDLNSPNYRGLKPNTFYSWVNPINSGGFHISFDSYDVNKYSEYMAEFNAGRDNISLSFGQINGENIVFTENSDLQTIQGKTYQLSVLNNIGILINA